MYPISLNYLFNITPILGLLKDPKEVMFESRSFLPKDSGKYKYQIIDIECTGSSLPYVDQAIQALDQDGLLCLTFTDLKVLTGSDYQKAYYYYGSTISKTDSTHEVRLILLKK